MIDSKHLKRFIKVLRKYDSHGESFVRGEKYATWMGNEFVVLKIDDLCDPLLEHGKFTDAHRNFYEWGMKQDFEIPVSLPSINMLDEVIKQNRNRANQYEPVRYLLGDLDADNASKFEYMINAEILRDIMWITGDLKPDAYYENGLLKLHYESWHIEMNAFVALIRHYKLK